jgi:transcriptional regulator with XRE-family HTH domain
VNIGSRVKEKRRGLKLSQEELARRAGVTLNAISQLERGISRDPHYSTLAGIAEALEISVAELIGETVPLGQAPTSSTLAEATDEERRAELEGMGHTLDAVLKDPEDIVEVRRGEDSLEYKYRGGLIAEALKDIREQQESPDLEVYKLFLEKTHDRLQRAFGISTTRIESTRSAQPEAAAGDAEEASETEAG